LPPRDAELEALEHVKVICGGLGQADERMMVLKSEIGDR
jgi:hypothetical protein